MPRSFSRRATAIAISPPFRCQSTPTKTSRHGAATALRDRPAQCIVRRDERQISAKRVHAELPGRRSVIIVRGVSRPVRGIDRAGAVLERSAVQGLAARDARPRQAPPLIARVEIEEAVPGRVMDENEWRRRAHDRRVGGMPGYDGVIGFKGAKRRRQRRHAPSHDGGIADRQISLAADAHMPPRLKTRPTGLDPLQRADRADAMALLAQGDDHRLGRARPGVVGGRIEAADDDEMHRGARRRDVRRASGPAVGTPQELDSGAIHALMQAGDTAGIGMRVRHAVLQPASRVGVAVKPGLNEGPGAAFLVAEARFLAQARA